MAGSYWRAGIGGNGRQPIWRLVLTSLALSTTVVGGACLLVWWWS